MIRLERITKQYGDVTVLDQLSFSLKPGDIHGLLGLNGAGKSTLIKLLNGTVEPTSGELSIDGTTTRLTPAEAIRQGIITVSQEVDDALYLDLPVYENVLPWQTVKRIRPQLLKQRAKDVLSRVDLDIDPTRPAGHYPLSVKQRLLIARALESDAKYLLLDEPTAALSETDTDALLELLQTLAAEGVGIVLVTHRSDELTRVTSTSTFLRDGRVVYEGPFQTLSTEAVQTFLSGTTFEGTQEKATPEEEIRLSAQVTLPAFGTNLSVEAYRGEVLGIGGLTGSGKTELVEALFGLSGLRQSITVDGTTHVIKEPIDAVRLGFALVPEERRRHGLFLDETIERNVIAVAGKTDGVSDVLASLRVRYANVKQTVGELSGGNQQKVVFSKWLLDDRDIYLLDEPTKGIDIAAKQDVYERVVALAKQGKTVLFTSSERHELERVANRILWLDRGQFVEKGGA
ncbi:sugar ABC transporter ATP-binding protein [Exiguobacterium sp. B2(2022)]|uniref:sugar ABC transporter ATP-binding protein n=1 Tax=Exiguobacterium sp. B2(2022) TaxID=2992755 RepID=UPI00237AD929|nr:sugar ABC transporter ATP-binding protein [Exiguobacterium sp. B2(2022)]MDE0563777.1 sugar ABC transporter ATP-binding protein [Exiguobacterium sp. B2(2022)]